LDFCIECVAEARGCAKHDFDLDLVEYIPMKECEKLLQKGYETFAQVLEKHGMEKDKIEKTIQELKKSSVPENVVPLGQIAFEKVLSFLKHQKLPCHQCKIAKPIQHEIVCKSGCGKRFCEWCLWNRYGRRIITCQLNAKWLCPCCTRECNCAACLRLRGIRPEDFVLEVNVPETELYTVASIEDIDSKILNSGITDKRPNPRPKQYNKSTKERPVVTPSKATEHLGPLGFVRRPGYPDWPCIEIVKPEVCPQVKKSEDGLVLVLFLCEHMTGWVPKESVIPWDALTSTSSNTSSTSNSPDNNNNSSSSSNGIHVEFNLNNISDPLVARKFLLAFDEALKIKKEKDTVRPASSTPPKKKRKISSKEKESEEPSKNKRKMSTDEKEPKPDVSQKPQDNLTGVNGRSSKKGGWEKKEKGKSEPNFQNGEPNGLSPTSKKRKKMEEEEEPYEPKEDIDPTDDLLEPEKKQRKGGGGRDRTTNRGGGGKRGRKPKASEDTSKGETSQSENNNEIPITSITRKH